MGASEGGFATPFMLIGQAQADLGWSGNRPRHIECNAVHPRWQRNDRCCAATLDQGMLHRVYAATLHTGSSLTAKLEQALLRLWP